MRYKIWLSIICVFLLPHESHAGLTAARRFLATNYAAKLSATGALCASGTDTNSFSDNIPLAAGTVNGNMVVVAIGQVTGTITPPAGYTAQYSTATNTAMAIYTHVWHTGDSATPSFSFNVASSPQWVACSYAGIAAVDGVTGISGGTNTTSIPSATGSGLTTGYANDILVSLYGGYIFTGGPTTLSYPGTLFEEGAFKTFSDYFYYSDEVIPSAGTNTGTMTATASQSLSQIGGAQLLLHVNSPPSVASSSTCFSAGSGPTVTCSITPAVGDMILLGIVSQSTVSTVADNKGNTWVHDGNVATANNVNIYRVSSALSGSATTITITEGAWGTAAAYVLDVHGTTGTLDRTSTNGAFGSAASTGSSTALSQATEFAFATCSTDQASTTISAGPTGGFTSLPEYQNSTGAPIMTVFGGYLTTSATTALNPGWTMSQNSSWGCVLGTYK